MYNILKFFKQNSSSFVPELASTLLIIVFASFLIGFSAYFIKKQDWNNITKRQYISFIRNFTIVLAIILLFFTWRGEIKAFIFSISAITVGIFVAFKEVILSFFSYFIISSNKLFKIGDIIEIDDKIGKVTDRTLLYTKISLVTTNHSKDLILPNNLFVTSKFLNLSGQEKYSKPISLFTTNEELDKKVDFLKEMLSVKFKDGLCTYEFYIEILNAREACLKCLIKNIGPEVQFNDIKNEIIMAFSKTFPPRLYIGDYAPSDTPIDKS